MLARLEYTYQHFSGRLDMSTSQAMLGYYTEFSWLRRSTTIFDYFEDVVTYISR